VKKYIIAILIIIIIVLSGTTLYFYNLYNDGKAFLVEDYYKGLVVVGNERVHEEIFKKSNDKWWIKADAAIQYIDSDIYYSGSGKRVYLPFRNLDLKLENRELTSYVSQNMNKMNIPVRMIDGVKYMDLDQLEALYPVRHEFYDETGVHLMIQESMETEQSIMITAQKLQDKPGKSRLEVGSAQKNEFVNVLSMDGDYALIMTSKGHSGYVPSSSLGKIETISISNEPIRKPIDRSDSEGRTRLVWQQIHDYKFYEGEMKYGPDEGLDIISPTWFSLNVDGIVLNIADKNYVNAAHEKGLKVWALFSNSFEPEWTHEMLTDETLKKRVISQILTYSALYNLDGINIDFENVYLKDKDAFSEFTAELTEMLHQQGMVVSVDVTVPWGSDMWSRFADREALSKSVDYVMLMAYDEHWGSSQVAGSVASRDWVEKGIVESLKIIPKEKLILGVPFYSRVWSQIGSGKVSSKSIGFNGQKNWLKDNDVASNYDSDTGQNYAMTTIDGVKKKIWLEDETSLKMRLDLAKKYDLPGIAGWSLLFTTDEVWNQIESEYPR